MNSSNKDYLIRVLSVMLGSFIYAISINSFVAPNKLLSGGVAGMSLLLQYLSKIPSGYWVLILNIPIFILGLKKVDKDFIFFSFLGMISMSTFLVLTKGIGSFIKVDDMIIATIFGAVLNGLGMGIIFKNRASQGGTDIIAVIIRNKNGAKISTLYFALNGIIVLLGAFATSLKLTLYTVILMYIQSVVIDKVIVGFEQKKALIIVTEKQELISENIMGKIGRGVTLFYGEGGYTGDHKKVIYCVVTLKELTKVKKLIEEIDKSALISVMDVAEVEGKGFLKPAL